VQNTVEHNGEIYSSSSSSIGPARVTQPTNSTLSEPSGKLDKIESEHETLKAYVAVVEEHMSNKGTLDIIKEAYYGPTEQRRRHARANIAQWASTQ